MWARWVGVVEHVEQVWRDPDEGIWEVRGPRRHFTHSKVMAWVVFDRSIKMAEKLELEAPLDRWRELRAEIHAQVCEHGLRLRARHLHAVLRVRRARRCGVVLVVVGFLPPDDERMIKTVDTIERELARDGLLSRYSTTHTDDGLSGDEGQFLACSFWLVGALALTGRIDKARSLYERLLGLTNDLGLLSEEYDVERRRQVGNFPQAFSHLGIINAARVIEHAEQALAQEPQHA